VAFRFFIRLLQIAVLRYVSYILFFLLLAYFSAFLLLAWYFLLCFFCVFL